MTSSRPEVPPLMQTTTSAPPTTTSAPPSIASAALTSTKSVATTPGPPTTLSAQINPKKGAGMVYFSNVNTALKDAQLVDVQLVV